MSETAEARDTLRRELLSELPSFYHPLLHFLCPTAFGLGALALAAWAFFQLGLPNGLELLTVPLTFLLANAAEWRTHKSVMHRPNARIPFIHKRHTLQHHRIYQHDNMAIQDWRELALIMFPPYAIVVVTVASAVPAALLAYLGQERAAVLFLATCANYVMVYEWLHTSFHLPAEHPIGKLAPIRWLARHHTQHHDPRVMSEYNMNVVVPLWDYVRRSFAPAATPDR